MLATVAGIEELPMAAPKQPLPAPTACQGGRIWTTVAQEQAFHRLALLHSLSRFSSYTRVVQPHAAKLPLQAGAASNPLRRVFF